MNLNQILPGTDYAWFPYRGRGEEFRWPNAYRPDNYGHGVHRVKAIRAFSERLPGNKRETGYVECFMLDDEGEFKRDSENSYITRRVRVRDLATLWEEYADERDYRQVRKDKEEKEREQRRREQEERWRREQEERERFRQEQLERERLERERVEAEKKAYLKRVEDHYRLPPGSVQLNGYNDLKLNKNLIDEELAREDAIDTTKPDWLESR